jgi:hypothetical protein
MARARLFAVFLLILSAFCGQAFAAIYYVDAASSEGNVTNAGTLEELPWQTITYALTQVATGDTIMVKAGTYSNAMTGSDESFPIIVTNNILVKGNGLVTVEGAASSNVFQLTAGGRLERLFINSNSSTNGVVIVGASTEVRACVINGFSRGVYLNTGAVQVTVESCTIVKNQRGIDRFQGLAIARNNIIALGGDGSIGISGTVTSTYNCLYANTTNWSGSSGEGDMVADPKFVSAEAKDYQLQYRSPAIDKGDPALPNDPDNTRADMGAYYRDQTTDPPIVFLTAPDGGNKIKGGITFEVTWAATQAAVGVNHVELAYSTDEGTTYPFSIATNEANDGSFSWTVPLISTQEAKVRAVAVSTGSVPGTAESASKFTIDSIAPVVSVTYPDGGEKLRGSTNCTITWTATDNFAMPANPITLSYTSSDAYVTIATGESNDGSYSWPLPEINTDEAGVKVTAVDDCGNTASDISSERFIIDITPPTAPVPVTPANGSTTKETTPQLTWEAATDNLSGVVSYEIHLDTSLITQGATTAYTPGTPLADGQHTWEVRAKDGAGIWGNYSSPPFTFTVKTAPPTLESILLRDRTTGSTLETNDRLVTVEATGVSGGPAEMLLASSADFSGATWRPYVNPGTFEVSAGEGTKTVYYKLRDAVGNVSLTVEAAIFLDLTPPLVTVEAPNGAEKWQGGTVKQITWQATDARGLGTNPITLYYTTGDAYVTIATNEANDGTFNWTLPSLNTSEAKVKIAAADRCGNVGSDESNAKFIIDITPPTAPVPVTPANGSTTKEAAPQLTWEAATDNLSGIVSYEVHLDTSLITQGATTAYTPGTPLADGLHTWEVRAKDGAGIWGSYSSPLFTFTVKTAPPTLESILLRDRTTRSTLETNDRVITVEAAGVAGSPAEMIMSESATFSGALWAAYQNPTTFELTSTDGLKTVYFKLRDAGLNESITVSRSITLDTSPPTLDRIELRDRTTGSTLETNDRVVTVEAFSVSGTPTSMEASEYEDFYGAVWLPFINPFNGELSPGSGTKTVYYRLRDRAENVSVTKEASIYVDLTRPLVTVESPAGGEKWAGARMRPIIFTATDESGIAPNSLTIRYSVNGGSSYPNLITQDAAVVSPYNWNVPGTINSTLVRVKVLVSDTHRNTGSGESAASFTVDSTPPLITAESPAGGEKWPGGAAKTITWRATDNLALAADSVYLYYATGETYLPIAAAIANNGTYPWTLPALNTSEARVRITASDECGNIGSRESGGFIIDITPPSVPTLLTPANGSITGEAKPLFSWGPATDNLSGIASYEIKLDTNLITQGATTTYTPATSLATGLHTWEVRAQDGAGWWGGYSGPWSFTIKLTGPTVSGITLKDQLTGSVNYTNARTVSLEAAGVSADAAEMIVSENADFAGAGWSTYANPTTFELSAAEALKTVRYKLRDIAQNQSVTREATIRLDTLPPLVTVEAPNGGERIAGGTVFTIRWAATDSGSGVKANGITLRLSTDSGASWSLIAGNENNDGAYSWTVPYGLESSHCRVSVEAEDQAANYGTDQSDDDFSIVTAGPAAPTLLTPADQSYLKTATPTLEWGAVNGAVKYAINLNGIEVASQTATSYTPGSRLPEAYHTWEVRAKNDVAIWGAYSAYRQFAVDLSAPTLIFGAFLDNANPLPSFEGRVTDNFKLASAEVRIDRGGWAPAPLSGQTSSEIFSYQVSSALTKGVHSIEARAYDAAGNLTPDSALALLIFNIVKSSVTVQTAVNGETLAAGKVISARPTFTVSISSPLAIVELKVSVDGTVVYLTDEHFQTKTVTVAPASDLTAGKHALKIELRNIYDDDFTTTYSNLTVISDVRVSAASTATSVTFAIETSSSGPAVFVLRRPGRETIFQKPIDDLGGVKTITVDRYVAGEQLKGPYLWKIIYNNGKSSNSGGFIVP